MIRKPLGRGLDALIDNTLAAAEQAAAEGRIVMAPVGKIVPGPFQPRTFFDPDKLAELTAAIKTQGVIEPLIVRPAPGPAAIDGPRYELIAGERRLRAARLAGLDTVPVIVRELDDRAALETALVENLVREDLSDLEEARAFARFAREFNLTHDAIAERVSKSRPYVTNQIRLLDLPAQVLEMVESGQLTASHARPLLSLEKAQLIIEAAQLLVTHKTPSRAAEALSQAARKSRRNKKGAARAVASDANVAALAESIQRALKRKVRIVRKQGRTPGHIEIDYYNDDDLTALARTLTRSASAVTMSARA
jgi:ParB family transcriptional regulator, chromosome partitioning protein